MPTRVVALLLLAASSLAAQSADWAVVKSLIPGTQVRLEAPHRLSGQIRSVSDDALVLRSGGREETVPRTQVVRLDVKKRGHHKRNALIGALVGAGVGAGIAAKSASCSGFDCIGSRAVEVGAPVGLGALGAVIGAVIPSGGWRQVYRSSARTP
jgi:hypothetical protein